MTISGKLKSIGALSLSLLLMVGLSGCGKTMQDDSYVIPGAQLNGEVVAPPAELPAPLTPKR